MNRAPAPGSLCTDTEPPQAVAIRRTTARPSPSPATPFSRARADR